MSMYTTSKKIDSTNLKLINDYIKTHNITTVKTFKKVRPFHGFTNNQVKALPYRSIKY